MFRWWDGSAWTPTLTPDPAAPPPGTPGGPLPVRGVRPGAAHEGLYEPQQPRRGGAWVALALVGLLVVALVMGGVWVLNRVGNPFTGTPPASNPTTDICPRVGATDVSPTPHVNPPGRVQGGRLSYPELGDPWSGVFAEERVPFGRDVYGQQVMVEPDYDGRGSSWVASLIVGELVAGDGFFSPEQGAEIVTRCVLGVFYGNAEVGRTDLVNRATTVDGYDAWEVEMHLDFSIPGLSETGETAIIVIVATSDESSSIYYASIPDSRPELLATARSVQEELRVEG